MICDIREFLRVLFSTFSVQFFIALYTVFQEESKIKMPELFGTEVNRRIQIRLRNSIDLIDSSSEAGRTCR